MGGDICMCKNSNASLLKHRGTYSFPLAHRQEGILLLYVFLCIPAALLPLTAADRSKAQCLLSRPYVKHSRFWQRQVSPHGSSRCGS